ncbi:hypothetical protein RQP46_010442 [Phenoliferia psychrophenolica]
MERPASKQLKKRSLSSSEPLPRAKKLKQKQKTSNRPRAYDESPPASASSEDDGDGSASEEEDEEARREAMIAALEAHQRALLADSLPSIAHRAAVQARKADTKSVWELDADDFEDDDDDEGDSSSEGDEEDGEPVASTSAAAGPLVVSFEEPRGAATAGTQRDMQAFMSAKVKNARPTFSVADLVNIKPFSHRQRTAKPSFADEEAESHLASLDASLSTLIRPLSQPSSLSTHSQLPSLLQSLPMAPTKLLKGLTPLPGNAPRTLRRGQEAANLKRARARDESAGTWWRQGTSGNVCDVASSFLSFTTSSPTFATSSFIPLINTMAPSDLVLVTGATGFIGTEVVLQYISAGFKVRGTARSPAKCAEWDAKHPETKGSLEWAIVKDIIEPGAFDEAIKGVTILAHTASPFHYDVKDNLKDMLNPAIQGTREALEAAKKTPSVKRVVVTSSFAAVLDLAKMPGVGVTYSDKDWNPATLEEATKAEHPGYVYCASKKLAEEEAWKIAKGASFSLTTLCPPMVFGPPKQVLKDMKSLNTSSEAVWGLVDATEVKPAAFPVFVDVRDIARLHVLATTEEAAKGQRYLCVAGHYDDSQIADIIIRNFPEQAHRIPKAPVTSGPEHFKTDTSKVEKELGIKWISFEESIKDTVKVIFDLEKSLKA